MAQVFPRGVSQDEFDSAFKAFSNIVGEEWASYTEQDQLLYTDAYVPGELDEFIGGGFVAPASVEEVQAVVRAANRHKVPIWPLSTGRNLAYGGAAPLMRGTVMLDLKRMNRILEVDEDLAYAVVEPGVSFFDLYQYFQENDIKLWTSVPGPGWGSIIGNGLEHGIGYGYYADHFDESCGLEIVLPSGELLRTGMGAMQNNSSWHTFNYGLGPAVEGIFTQSNYGIVTRMGRNLIPEPETYMSCEVNCRFDKGLEDIIEKLRPFKMDETIRNPLVVSNMEIIASFLSVRSQWYDGDGPIPDDVLETIQDALNLGRWNASFALYGSDVKVNDSWSRIKDAVKDIPGVEIHDRVYHPGDEILHPRDQSQAGIPSLNEFGLVNWLGAGGHIDFSPAGPMRGRDARIMADLVRSRTHEYGFDHLGGFYALGRSFLCVNTLIFRKNNPEDMQRVRELFTVLIQDFAERGYAEYRTHLAYMEQVAGTFNYNDNSMLRFQETLKDAIDPEGIIAPGKSGIWPQRYRG
jgi:4-cresol dehydrogenase (hydroxylating)